MHDDEEVTVGEDGDVMGGIAAVSGIAVIPDEAAVIGDYLDSTTTRVNGEVHGAVMIHVRVI